ncbi:serine/arginine-rich splicing factor SR45-like [Calypte anna]|uniref:serine/arginine-rich splicing factor SR45-like n=1 Tax=Calypte anna TaxID=9244 RepID=UPI0011C34D91|nr:serine/arginine-rich splicing factor SR45-like [Calypte anna]
MQAGFRGSAGPRSPHLPWRCPPPPARGFRPPPGTAGQGSGATFPDLYGPFRGFYSFYTFLSADLNPPLTERQEEKERPSSETGGRRSVRRGGSTGYWGSTRHPSSPPPQIPAATAPRPASPHVRRPSPRQGNFWDSPSGEKPPNLVRASPRHRPAMGSAPALAAGSGFPGATYDSTAHHKREISGAAGEKRRNLSPGPRGCPGHAPTALRCRPCRRALRQRRRTRRIHPPSGAPAERPRRAAWYPRAPYRYPRVSASPAPPVGRRGFSAWLLGSPSPVCGATQPCLGPALPVCPSRSRLWIRPPGGEPHVSPSSRDTASPPRSPRWWLWSWALNMGVCPVL